MDDKLLMAALAEIKTELMKKMIAYRTEYKITLTAVQAIALSIFNDDFIDETKTDVGAKLLLISNEVKQKFN